MCYKDWVTLFSRFSVCLLPMEFEHGPSFGDEQFISGSFQQSSKIAIELKVIARRNFFIQTLLDCNIASAKEEQLLLVNMIDKDGKYVYPRLPNDYAPNRMSNYCHNG